MCWVAASKLLVLTLIDMLVVQLGHVAQVLKRMYQINQRMYQHE